MKDFRTILVAALGLLAMTGHSEPLRYKLPDHAGFVHAPRLSVGQPVPPASFTPIFAYTWSLSGDRYAEVRVGIDHLGPFSIDGIQAIRLSDNTPALGIGLSWRQERARLIYTAGAAVLAPQKSRIDVTFGAGVGVRF